MNARQKSTLALVNKALQALPYLSGVSFKDGLDHLVSMNTAEEKQHRKYAPDGCHHCTKIVDAARLMTVYDIARALLKPGQPQWKDFLSLRPSYITAAALADVNRDAIVNAWGSCGVSIDAIAALDYAGFVQGKE